MNDFQARLNALSGEVAGAPVGRYVDEWLSIEHLLTPDFRSLGELMSRYAHNHVDHIPNVLTREMQ